MSVSITAIQFEHHESGFGIGHRQPRVSWRFDSTTTKDWYQSAYEIEITHLESQVEVYKVESSESILVLWPSKPLQSRERVQVRVRSFGGDDGQATNWVEGDIEVGLLERDDWSASMITGATQDRDLPKRPYRVRKTFILSTSSIGHARLYATAYGLYEVELNGTVVGDQVLAPGWTVYRDRLRYQIYDITSLLRPGENTISAYIGEGWYAGRMGNRGGRNISGDTLAFLAQLEIDGEKVLVTDESWEYLDGEISRSEIYDGEDIDTNFLDTSTKITPVRILPFPTAQLIASDAPPVRRICEIKPIEIITTPNGKKILDFGQNLVGWLRADEEFSHEKRGQIIIRHAEVIEDGELGVRPLRTAAAIDRITLGSKIRGWQPKFTFHGFRYAEVTGIADLSLSTFTAVVISSDLRRTGDFECSHKAINRLYQNVIWSMRGNFVSVPTDCPQRDERLGWTGDIQVFAPTANYLFDTSAFLSEWLWDLDSEQKTQNGVPPFVIPDVPMRADRKAVPHAVWADVTALLPRDLYLTTADKAILLRQFDSMRDWLDKGVPRREDGLWDHNVAQFADWLDPRAPPLYPAHGLTDTHLVANAYLIHTTQSVSLIAEKLGKTSEAEKYRQDADRFKQLFQDEYISPNGRLTSDSQTAIALALQFNLLEAKHRKKAAERLEYITRWWSFKISTGFAGTPIILQALAENGHLGVAYRMLQERDNPSWLYPVGMGATTIWERWDSMLEDGKINPGTMTSFNHYALGAVANFLHNTVAGLSTTTPGWKQALIRPRPGGTINSAKTSFVSPYGRYAVEWEIIDDKLKVNCEIPPNTSANIDLPGGNQVETVGSGKYEWEVQWKKDETWPPKQAPGPSSRQMPDEFVP